ncbi:DUF5047 domain-containing protein [Kribbella jiaozuonensis]|uniref:DUF5047 domain-containing protein n=1 Tax=Kribbella jiaozuonensis TaxID=2575441 RepID=A0A4U3LVC2_9ACTN|nr:DUF5047 domain-containing protein [Kribbella jiaozuonensis]TKK79194.1 DUF5047 domain-containing protein [Kribbella jiaozuonensis]TKK83264.1 DUF5047 domain-containing protein [Kribbella jiaozuonensis]
MRGVSDRFLKTLRGSHSAVFRARVCTSFQTGTNPTGTEIPILPGSDVQCASTADIRATLNLTTSASWPRRAGDLLAPYGNEIYVERGLSYGNGQTEFVGLGYFRINAPEQEETPNGPVEISGADRMAGIKDARFLTPRQFASSLTRGQLVSTLITEVYPSAVIEWDDTGVRDAAVGRTVLADRERFDTLRDLVTSLGKVGYFDHRGVFVVRTPPDVSGAPAWTIDAGANGVLVKMSRAITREGIYNVVVASGEATDTTPPVWAAVADLSPSSPTRYGGRFGPVPRFYSSPFITTTDQARSAASVLLRKSLGLPYQVALQSIANPALEPDDVLKVRYPSGTRSLSLKTEAHIIDTVTIPLDEETPVSLRTRKQYGEQIGDVTE